MGEQTLESRSLEIKKDINNLLWVLLPGTTTLGEAEDIAINIQSLIIAEYEKGLHKRTLEKFIE